jgi:hypothetical protein
MKSGCGRDGSEVETHQTASTNVLHTVPTVASRAAHSGGVSWNLADSGELQRRRGEADVTAVDLLVFGPWLIFGAGMAVIGYLLLRRHGTTRHRRRHNR